MGIRDVAWKTVRWPFMKKHLGYTSEEMKLFRSNPRNEDVESAGCNSQHKIGDRFLFDGVDRERA